MELTLEQFLASKHPNLWIYEPKMKAYVRKGMHALNRGVLSKCLDLANIEVYEEFRSQGVFREFLDRAEALANERRWAVFVESLLEPRLEKFLVARGYAISPFSPRPAISLYKLPTNPENLAT